MMVDLSAKRLEILNTAFPHATRAIIFWNPERHDNAAEVKASADAGHFPHWEQPQAFADRVTAFVG